MRLDAIIKLDDITIKTQIPFPLYLLKISKIFGLILEWNTYLSLPTFFLDFYSSTLYIPLNSMSIAMYTKSHGKMIKYGLSKLQYTNYKYISVVKYLIAQILIIQTRFKSIINATIYDLKCKILNSNCIKQNCFLEKSNFSTTLDFSGASKNKIDLFNIIMIFILVNVQLK